MTLSQSTHACIFDMDDTLVATTPIWRGAETDLFHALGRKWDAEVAKQYKGMNAMDVATTIHAHVQPGIPLQACLQLLRESLILRSRTTSVKALPGAVEIVQYLHGRTQLAVASGSPLEVIEQLMELLGIRDRFDVLLSSESVPRGKPHPDIFLASASKLNVSPEDCVVFEDSLIGAQAGKAAGMRVVCVPSSNNAGAIAPYADLVLSSLADARAHVDVLRLY